MSGRLPAQRCPNGGKLRYPTEHEAQVALIDAVIAANRGNVKRTERRHYWCRACGGWHLTSMPYVRPVRRP